MQELKKENNNLEQERILTHVKKCSLSYQANMIKSRVIDLQKQNLFKNK